MSEQIASDAEADTRLLHRLLCDMKLARRGGVPRLTRVAELFSTGPTAAIKTCNRHGFDPYEMVTRK
jgi:hypothetical protein